VYHLFGVIIILSITNCAHLFIGNGRNYREMFSQTIDGRYKCERCHKTTTYKHKPNIYRHLREECGVNPSHLCNFCDYQTNRKGDLKTHMILIHKKIL